MGNKYFISYTAITFPAPSPVGLASPWTEVTLFKYSHGIFHKSYYNRFNKRMVGVTTKEGSKGNRKDDGRTSERSLFGVTGAIVLRICDKNEGATCLPKPRRR